MNAKELTIVTVILTSCFTGLAQKDQHEDLKGLLKPQIVKILEQYQQYSQFTTDGEKIDTSYINKFLRLFVPTEATVVYNDLKFKGSVAEDYFSPSGYAKYARINFTYGLDVSLPDYANFGYVSFVEKNGIYTITVKVTKKLAGVYKTEKIHKINTPLYFTLTASATQGNLTPLKISRISNEEGYRSFSASSKMKGLYLGLSSGMGKTKLVNSFSYWTPEAQSNILKGLELSIYLSKGFGLGTGIFFGNYSTSYRFSPYIELDKVSDPDGDSYRPQLTTNNLVETDKIRSIDIPVLLKFRTGNARTGLYFDLGIIYSKFSKASYSLEGSLTRKGYYDQWGVTLENIPVDGYDFETFNYPADLEADDTQLAIPTSGVNVYGAFGLSFPLYQGLFLKIGANYTYGLTELPTTRTNHWVFLDSKNPIKIQSFGFEIGLSYKITNR